MKRWVLADIIGDGQSPETAYRHAVQDVPDVLFAAGEIASNPDGTPANQASLVLVASRDVARLNQRTDLHVLPVVGYDLRIQAAAAPARDALLARMAARGITLAGQGLTDQSPWRGLLNALGRVNHPAFDADAYDLNENDIPTPL